MECADADSELTDITLEVQVLSQQSLAKELSEFLKDQSSTPTQDVHTFTKEIGLFIAGREESRNCSPETPTPSPFCDPANISGSRTSLFGWRTVPDEAEVQNE